MFGCLCSVSNYKRITVAKDESSVAVPDANKLNFSQHESTQTSSAHARVATAAAVLTESKFNHIFLNACTRSWQSIVNDPLFSIPQSKYGLVFINYASCILQHSGAMDCGILKDNVKDLFCGRSLASQNDRDLLMRDIQLLRTSASNSQAFVCYVVDLVPLADVDVCQLLFHVWLRKLVCEMLGLLTESCCETPETTFHEPLSDVDQNVLYYISGFMAKKLQAACLKYCKLQPLEGLVQCLTTHEPKLFQHFVHKYTSWVERQSRGGLLYPIADFYLMVREFDIIYRQSVSSTTLGSKIINQGQLKLQMSQSTIVKLHWDKILQISHSEESNSQPALDYLMTLFITVKGFAVARKEHERLENTIAKKKITKKVNRSKSLRGNLKKSD